MMSVGPVLFPTLLLTTTGHRSGKPCTTPLFFVRDGESIIVAGSNFGLPAHPVWSENLLRNREATVQIGQGSRRYTARPATESEAARAWPRLVEFWPAYDRYRERAGRDIRIFVLTPA
jgi:deazaflavin-dependent oxidoreductase (nitroreductase family)